MPDQISIGEALTRLDQLLPEYAPKLALDLNPPASEADLESLRRAMAPLTVPDDLLELYRWHNGSNNEWWPVMSCGPLLRGDEAVSACELLRKNTTADTWRRSWFPIAADGWLNAVIETSERGCGMIIEGSFPNPPGPLAPSLIAMLHATCEVLEAGISPELDLDTDQAPDDERDAIVAATYSAYSWPVGDDYWSELATW
jgi:hypothetical protein